MVGNKFTAMSSDHLVTLWYFHRLLALGAKSLLFLSSWSLLQCWRIYTPSEYGLYCCPILKSLASHLDAQLYLKLLFQNPSKQAIQPLKCEDNNCSDRSCPYDVGLLFPALCTRPQPFCSRQKGKGRWYLKDLCLSFCPLTETWRRAEEGEAAVTCGAYATVPQLALPTRDPHDLTSLCFLACPGCERKLFHAALWI